MAYYAHTHKFEEIQRPELFLTVLLSTETSNSTTTIVNLPANYDIINALALSNTPLLVIDSKIQINHLFVTIWRNKQGVYEWCIEYVKGVYEWCIE